MSKIQKNEELVMNYYKNWAGNNRIDVRESLTDDFIYRSRQGIFKKRDDYLNSSWQQIEKMGGVEGVEFPHLIANDTEAFVIVKWIMGKGKSGHTAEVIKVNNNKIKEILIINHEPKFYETLMREE
ncbi:MAG: hypothetical protein ACFE95_05790 [Candidatus Hodarchaeota archaeon]